MICPGSFFLCSRIACIERGEGSDSKSKSNRKSIFHSGWTGHRRIHEPDHHHHRCNDCCLADRKRKGAGTAYRLLLHVYSASVVVYRRMDCSIKDQAQKTLYLHPVRHDLLWDAAGNNSIVLWGKVSGHGGHSGGRTCWMYERGTYGSERGEGTCTPQKKSGTPLICTNYRTGKKYLPQLFILQAFLQKLYFVFRIHLQPNIWEVS